MERYSMFLGRKNQYCENDYTTKSNLQTQCNPYQITSGIFHRTRRKNFTIHMETQKTLNSKSNRERRMELEESTFLTSNYTTKLLSSRQYGSVQFSCPVVSDSLRPHELQHTRPPCPSPTPRVHSNSCPLSW